MSFKSQASSQKVHVPTNQKGLLVNLGLLKNYEL